MIIEVDARRIRENHLILRTLKGKSYEYKVIEITQRKCGNSSFSYKMRYIKYEDGAITSISLSPASIGGWEIMKLKLDNFLRLMFLPLLLDAIDKYKYFDYLRLFLLIILFIITFSYFFNLK